MSKWGKRKGKFGGDSDTKSYPNKTARTEEDVDDSDTIVVCEVLHLHLFVFLCELGLGFL